MPEYDSALKLLLRQPARRAIAMLARVPMRKWLDIELPKTQNLRMDMLGEDMVGDLHHIELQSTNDSGINLRMAEYALGTYRLLRKFPRQTVLYVGEAPLTMPDELRGSDFWARYRAIDVRDLDGEALLASDDVGDNVIAILTKLRDHREAVRKIVAKIGTLPESERNVATQQLVILAGLRRLEPMVQEEVKRMPIIIISWRTRSLDPRSARVWSKGFKRATRKAGRKAGRRAKGTCFAWWCKSALAHCPIGRARNWPACRSRRSKRWASGFLKRLRSKTFCVRLAVVVVDIEA